MSLPLRKRLLLSLSPTRLTAVLVGGAPRRRVLDHYNAAVDAAHGTDSWRGVIAALASEADALLAHARDVHVVLSNHFARYVIVPPGADAANADEDEALARFHFTRVYGERAGAWNVRVNDDSPAVPRLACAIDGDLVQALHASCAPHRARLASMQPYLVSAFNYWRRSLPRNGAWFLTVEPERACLALVAGGRWISVHNARGDYDDPESWIALVERQRWSTDLAEPPRDILVHGARNGATLAAPAEWSLLPQDNALPAWLRDPASAEYAAAMTLT